MDCRQAQDTLAALRGGCESDEIAAKAIRHAASCPECAAFSVALATLEAIPAPAAPWDLAQRIDLAVATEATLMNEQAALAAAQQALVPSPATSASPGEAAPAGIPPWLTRTRLWTATGAITLAAASVVIAVIVSGQNADRAALSRLTEESAQAGAGKDVAGAATAGPPATLTPSAPVTIPDYVAYQAVAYGAGAMVEALPSDATTAGAIQSALRGGTVQTVTVLFAPGSPRDIILALPTGGYQTFSAVTRTLANRTYQLRSGPLLDRFGAWPTLPQGYNQPTSAEGAPYYRAAGTDALGVRVYVLIGQTPELGFGIAPGTPTTDPAAGNPNWTWWSPVP